LNLESKSALASIKEILSFTQQAQLAVSEENVTQNIGFFTQLLQNLKKELSREDISQYNPDDLLNAIQFSFAMNYDDNDLWFKIYQITSVLI